MLLVIGLTQEGLYLRAETRQRAAIAAVFAHRFAAVLAFACAVGGLAAVHTLACLAPSSAPLAQQTALPFLYGLRGYALPPSAGERGAPNINGRIGNAKIVTPTPMSKAMVTDSTAGPRTVALAVFESFRPSFVQIAAAAEQSAVAGRLIATSS